jgi:catechol 2,3-dioxygenase-like lactoylglutathione lyase family enzyme
MKLQRLLSNSILGTALLAASLGAAELAAPNPSGISAGHTHLSVPDVAKHREIWKKLGATEHSQGRLQLLYFPNMYILLAERVPTSPSGDTSANHIGFTVKDYPYYRGLLDELGVTNFIVDDNENGQVLADLPDGVRIEFAKNEMQAEPILFHHTHLAALDGATLRDWYVKVFGAEVGERRNLPSAVIPGGRVDFLPARGDAPKGSQGTAAHVAALGLTFDRAPEYIEAIDLKIAFLTDPVGTYIEVTEGLDDVE